MRHALVSCVLLFHDAWCPIQIVLEAMDTLGIALADPALETAKQSVLAVDLAAFAYNLRLVSTLDALQKDAGFQECFQRRDEYWIMDAVDYYLEHKARFAESEFQPTEEDIVMARVRTTGIVVSIIEEPPARFSIVDVGGQRSERRKWIHCFDDVKAIVFLSGLSGYNQVLFEDSSTNRLAESLTLFEDIVKNPAFATTPLYLLLNKKDLFEQMISKHELKKAFPDYSGPEGKVLPAAEFISNKFRAIAKRHRPSHPPAVHIVAARVRMDMKTFFKELKADLRGKRGHNNTTRGVLGKHG